VPAVEAGVTEWFDAPNADAEKAAIDKATAEAQLEQMTTIALTFERKAGEHGTLFGSVTSMPTLYLATPLSSNLSPLMPNVKHATSPGNMPAVLGRAAPRWPYVGRGSRISSVGA